jgi:GAF domain-containing protein
MAEINVNENSLLSDILIAGLDGEKNAIANLSNAAAVLKQFVIDTNWTGFYLYEPESGDLVLGPFQGITATPRINPENGVVGAAFTAQEVVVVGDVHEFEGHIACDPASNSEVVIPLTRENGEKVGVIDIDAPVTNRFDDQTVAELKEFAKTLIKYI